MRLRSFQASNMAEALAQVRAALGEDAVIVATHDETGGGVRVTAAVEDSIAETNSASPTVAVAPISHTDQAAELCYRHGLLASSATRFIDQIGQHGHLAWEDALHAALPKLLPLQAISPKQRPIMLLGPTGMGKTLCIAKWAIALAADMPDVQIFSTDIDRAGAVAQLNDLVRWVNLSVIEADGPAALKDGLELKNPLPPTLIDTAGINLYDAGERKQAQALLQRVGAHVLPVLVLPAGGDARELGDWAEFYADLGVRHLLPTKLDAAGRIGGILHAAIEHRYILTHYSADTRAAAGVPALTPEVLAKFLLSPPQFKERI